NLRADHSRMAPSCPSKAPASPSPAAFLPHLSLLWFRALSRRQALRAFLQSRLLSLSPARPSEEQRRASIPSPPLLPARPRLPGGRRRTTTFPRACSPRVEPERAPQAHFVIPSGT